MKMATRKNVAEAGAEKANGLNNQVLDLKSGTVLNFSDQQVADLVAPLKKDVDEILKKERDLVVTSSNKSDANEFASRIKKGFRFLDGKREEIKRPYLEAGRTIDGAFKPLTNSLKSAEESLGKKLTVVLQAERRAAEEEAKKAAEKARKEAEVAAKKEGMSKLEAAAVGKEVAQVTFTSVASCAPTGMSTQSGSSKLKVTKGFEVLDITQVPAQYLMIDRVSLMAAINSGIENIPGIKITETENIQFRSR